MPRTYVVPSMLCNMLLAHDNDKSKGPDSRKCSPGHAPRKLALTRTHKCNQMQPLAEDWPTASIAWTNSACASFQERGTWGSGIGPGYLWYALIGSTHKSCTQTPSRAAASYLSSHVGQKVYITYGLILHKTTKMRWL